MRFVTSTQGQKGYAWNIGSRMRMRVRTNSWIAWTNLLQLLEMLFSILIMYYLSFIMYPY